MNPRVRVLCARTSAVERWSLGATLTTVEVLVASEKQAGHDDEYEYIFVKSYRHKWTGKIMIAAHYGLEAFCFKVKRGAR